MIKELNTLHNRYVIEPVFESVLSANLTTLTIPVTPGNGWRLEFAIKALATGDMSLLFNTDTVETNYYSTNLAGAQTNDRAYLAYANAANDFIHGTIDLKICHDRVTYVSRTIRISGTTIANIGLVVTKNASITQLTQLLVTSPVSNMFLSGSWFRLYHIC